jgi:hypothetical protein
MVMRTKKLSGRRSIRHTGLKAPNVKARAEGPGMLRPKSVSPERAKQYQDTDPLNQAQIMQKPPESNQIKPRHRASPDLVDSAIKPLESER